MECDRYAPETSRIKYCLRHNGFKETLDFVKRTMHSYRAHILNKDLSHQYRNGFIQSYLAFKRYYLDYKDFL